jgi:hypothetical protein
MLPFSGWGEREEKDQVFVYTLHTFQSNLANYGPVNIFSRNNSIQLWDPPGHNVFYSTGIEVGQQRVGWQVSLTYLLDRSARKMRSNSFWFAGPSIVREENDTIRENRIDDLITNLQVDDLFMPCLAVGAIPLTTIQVISSKDIVIYHGLGRRSDILS